LRLRIIIPKDNALDLHDIPARYREGLTFYPENDLKEVLEMALVYRSKDIATPKL
jgi:ATP-dependent Lon protease